MNRAPTALWGRGVFPDSSRTPQLRLICSETLGGLLAADYAVVSGGP